jgi:hypothetical protein
MAGVRVGQVAGKEAGMIHRRCRGRAVLGVAILVAACGGEQGRGPAGALARVTPAVSDSTFRAAAREATMVFVGTIVRRGATTDAEVTPSRLTTIVRADSVLRGPPGAGNFAGDTLTLISAGTDTVGLVDGRRATFFAYGLAAGETLIVRGTLAFDASDPDSVNIVAEAFRQAAQLDADEALARLARRADLVVSGIVRRQAVVVIPDSIRRRYGNERSPQWWQAAISNAGYFGGDSTLMRPSWSVFYPVGSDNSRPWLRRFAPGDTMIFLLRRASGLPSGLLRAVDTTGRFFLFDSAEVLPRSDSARVRRVFR